ncbi:MAG: glycosyltransferase, partial [Lentisphaeraceae bacterium]|nr:glycosyltransferase [Lentisphaeraceae bacterium]
LVRKMRGMQISRNDKLTLPGVSILVPVLNEANNAAEFMKRLNSQSVKAHEIIVIDGGSTDESVQKFTDAGARVIHCETRGRGNQLVQGLKQASGEAVLILHADMLPQENVVEKTARALASDKKLVGGVLGARFQSNKFKYKVITFLNKLRVVLSGISFGDQGQFFRRQVALEHNCLPAIPLMEDVELGMRLQAVGKTCLLDGGLEVSVRRWKSKNVWSNAFHIFFLLSRYLVLRRVQKSLKVDKFYDEYYSDEGAETA